MSLQMAYAQKLSKVECSCVTELQHDLEIQRKQLVDHYRFNLNSHLKLQNDPLFLEGTNKEHVIILFHGFIASPFEMKEIAEKFNDMGFSVYLPLLYGFGSDSETANKGSIDIWRKQVSSTVEAFSKCYSKISLGGISLGSALVTDYALNNSKIKLSSLMLFSPYFDVSQAVGKLLIGPLKTVKDSVGLDILYSLSKSPDLVEILRNKSFYTDSMPFQALAEIFKLSDELLNFSSAQKLNVPVFVALSEADETINLTTAESYPKKHFKQIEYFKISKDKKVPHQITYKQSNPVFRQMTNSLSKFIRSL
jgi:esterase/lipase